MFCSHQATLKCIPSRVADQCPTQSVDPRLGFSAGTQGDHHLQLLDCFLPLSEGTVWSMAQSYSVTAAGSAGDGGVSSANIMPWVPMQRVFDYRVHTHAKYAVCDEADVFENAEYMPDMKQPGIQDAPAPLWPGSIIESQPTHPLRLTTNREADCCSGLLKVLPLRDAPSQRIAVLQRNW